MHKNPEITLNIHLVRHGYEIDIYKSGKIYRNLSRDFSTNHHVRTIKEALVGILLKTIIDFTRKL